MDRIEEKIIRIIEAHEPMIMDFAKDMEDHPEPGFEEMRTAKKTAEIFEKLGYYVQEGLARTGVLAERRPNNKGQSVGQTMEWKEKDAHLSEKTLRNRPNITVIGELDAIGCRSHPKADPRTGVAHACGHHAQMAAMLGAAIALADEEVAAQLDGTVSFLAVPAEEYIDADKRVWLKKEGVGFVGSGKSELIRLGAFERTDIAMTTHVHMVPVKEDFYLGNPACNGFTAERVTVRGKAAHAAIAPWEGVNALSITNSAISMMGLMRETFREQDHVRLHNVIRKAGDVINSVPDEAIVETKVRASSLSKIREIQNMVNRAYDGAAYAFGGKIEKESLQGYMPVLFREADDVLIEAAEDLGVSYRCVDKSDFNDACTDVGDLTHLFPVLNFTFSGFAGKLHGADFSIKDTEKAYILPAKMLALTVYKLLKNNASAAEKIIREFKPVFTREEYVKYIIKENELETAAR